MSEFIRGAVTVSTKVSVSADEFWALLRDWPAVLSWVLPAGSTAPTRVTLKDGHHNDVLPCTRVLHSDRPQTYSHEETLIFADPEARRIYYTFNGIPGGIRNYLATTFVDPDGKHAAVVTCSSSFDLPAGNSMTTTEKYLKDAYRQHIAKGIEGAILARRPKSHT
jgi:hypothetical protein